MSNGLAPGAIALLKATGAQATWSPVKPIAWATASATAASKPCPLSGSPSPHLALAGVLGSGWKYGGYAGLSAPIVILPEATVAIPAHAFAVGLAVAGATDGATEAAVEDAAAVGDA